MKATILRNIFLSVAALFAFAQLLTAGININDGSLDFSNRPFVRPHAQHSRLYLGGIFEYF